MTFEGLKAALESARAALENAQATVKLLEDALHEHQTACVHPTEQYHRYGAPNHVVCGACESFVEVAPGLGLSQTK